MNMRTGLLTISRIALLAGLSTLAVGCGSSGKATPLTEVTYCAQRATAECATVAGTCQAATMDCETARAALCMQEGADIQTADPTRVFHPENVPACVAKAKAVYGITTTIKPIDLAGLTDVCNYVYHGDVPMLMPCTTKYDCKDATVICDKGYCATQVIKGAGLQCSDYGAVCGASQYCSTVGAAMKCVDKGKVGQACDAANPCGSGLYCTNGTCQLSLGVNAKCCTDSDCSSDFPYCNPYAGYSCGKGLTFATNSPSCVPFGDTAATPATGTPTCTSGPAPDAGTPADAAQD